MQRPILYLRALRQADHTVFSVAEGQKFYRDPSSGRNQPFSSGQQVKRSILDHLVQLLGVGRAPVEFRWKIDPKDKKKVGEDIAVLPLNPAYVDMLLGGYMKASGKDTDKDEEDGGAKVIKRRSPLSISAMRPLHPLLSGMEAEKSMSFDRTGDPGSTVKLYDDKGKPMTEAEMLKFIEETGNYLRKAKYIDPSRQQRAYGLFVYDIAIDLRRLFSASAEISDPEITQATKDELINLGWVASKNAFGNCLILPKEKREAVIPALAEALLEWQITSNQARTYSPMPTLAIAMGERANAVAAAIRADLGFDPDRNRDRATPTLDERMGAEVFVTPMAQSYISGAQGDPEALDKARQWLIDRMRSFDYENQIKPL